MAAEQEHWQEVQNKFYDQAEKHSHLAYSPASAYARDLVEHLQRATQLSSAHTVLEVGAGAGRFSFHLAPYCKRLIALDTSSALLEALHRESHEGVPIEPVCASVFDLQKTFGPMTFDAVCGFFILHHLPDHEKLFRLIHQSLKPGGRVAFVEPNRLNPSFLLQVMISREMTWKAEKGMFTFSANRTARILENSGFTDIQCIRFGLFPPQILDPFPGLLKVQRAIEWFRPTRRILPFVLMVAHRA